MPLGQVQMRSLGRDETEVKIYTRGGDKGETTLLGGVRVAKNDPRVTAYGTVDELNAALGVVIALENGGKPSGFSDDLRTLQEDLFTMGARLAAAASPGVLFLALRKELHGGNVGREREGAEPVAPIGAPIAAPDTLAALEATIASRRREMPEGSYTTHLFSSGTKKIRKKLGEEAIEVIGADSAAELVSEAADLIYHLLVLLADEGVNFQQVLSELQARHG